MTKGVREGLGVLCVAAILWLVGSAIGDPVGGMVVGVGIMAALLGLALLAYGLLAERPSGD